MSKVTPTSDGPTFPMGSLSVRVQQGAGGWRGRLGVLCGQRGRWGRGLARVVAFLSEGSIHSVRLGRLAPVKKQRHGQPLKTDSH